MITMRVPGFSPSGAREIEITGFDRDPFVLHESERDVTINAEVTIRVWSVTVKHRGFRFPWWFMTREAADSFAADVAPLMNWQKVSARPPRDPSKRSADWTRPPTKEQSEAIVAAAAARGGLKITTR
jgi:hypothetical protein